MIIITIKLLTCCVKICNIMFKLYFLKKLLIFVTLTLTLLLNILMLNFNVKIMFCIKIIKIIMKFKIIVCQL